MYFVNEHCIELPLTKLLISKENLPIFYQFINQMHWKLKGCNQVGKHHQALQEEKQWKHIN
jgi:hypothetical protein